MVSPARTGAAKNGVITIGFCATLKPCDGFRVTRFEGADGCMLTVGNNFMLHIVKDSLALRGRRPLNKPD